MNSGLGPQEKAPSDSGGSTTTESATLTEDVAVNVAISEAAPAGTVFTKGMNLTELFKAISQNVFVPQLINPSFSLSIGGSSLKKIGTTPTFNLIFNFNRGKIKGANNSSGDWEANKKQADRAGSSNFYEFNGVDNGNSNVKSITENVVQGITFHSAIVNYNEGPQPLKSDGSNYGSPFPSGTSPVKTDTYEGVYPLFAVTSNITTATEQALRSMLNANNIVFDLVDETPGNKQFFDIPNAWLSQRSLQKVEYFNTVSGSFDATNKAADFTQSSVTKTIAGVSNVNYTRFTHNGSDRGAIKIRLKF